MCDSRNNRTDFAIFIVKTMWITKVFYVFKIRKEGQKVYK